MLAADQAIHEQDEQQTDNSVLDDEEQTAHILLSDHDFDAYYLAQEEENRSFETDSDDPHRTEVDSKQLIERAEELVQNFEYQEGLGLCLRALEVDYDNIEAHRLVLETFNCLGFRNQLTLKTKDALKDIMLKSKI